MGKLTDLATNYWIIHRIFQIVCVVVSSFWDKYHLLPSGSFKNPQIAGDTKTRTK